MPIGEERNESTEVGNSLQSANAGARGPDVCDDCWVEVRSVQGSAAAPVIELSTRAGSLDDNSIRDVAGQTLAALDAGGLSIRIEDSGALPFTIMARIEAAVGRLRGPDAGVALPPFQPADPPPKFARPDSPDTAFCPGKHPEVFPKSGLVRP